LPAPHDDACRQGTPVDNTLPECHCCRADVALGPSGDAHPRADPKWLSHLYLCREYSTYEIARRTGLDRQRVTRILRNSMVPLRPRGAGRRRPLRRAADPPDLPRLMRNLYEDAKLNSRQVSAILDMPERTVRERLRRYGISSRTRGRCNREDRKTVPAEVLQLLYRELGMSAAEVGRRLGISGNIVLRDAHALGIPVRSGGAVPLSGPDEIQLVAALYADPPIAAVLTARGIPRVPTGGSLADRFPRPVPLTTPLVKDLYWGCGIGLSHIELLTGQAAGSVRGFMRRAGIPLRPAGGRTPFRRRWRAGLADDPVALPRDRPHQEPLQDAGHAERAASTEKEEKLNDDIGCD
jgi:hypothetical protein